MSPELVVTPGGYRPAGVVHRIQPDRKLRILTGRLQGIDSSGQALDDYGSIPRDGGNPALTPGYALPPGLETEEGAEPAPPHGRGWIAYAHWTNEGNQPITSFRSTWTVPAEPATRSGQTVFLFIGMQDSIPMTLIPALQWGPSAAGGGEYWSIASWYVGGTTGAVFYGDLARVAAGDELTAVIELTEQRRGYSDYRCGFEGFPKIDFHACNVKELSRSGVVLAAYGIKRCSDYPATRLAGFRGLDIQTRGPRPAIGWTPVDAVTDCGQHIVALSDANPGGEVVVHFARTPAEPEPVPAIDVPDAQEGTAGATSTGPEEPAVEAPAAAKAPESEPVADSKPPESAPVADAKQPGAAVATLSSMLERGSAEGRLVEITINNHGAPGPASGAMEMRLAALEAAIAALSNAIAPGRRPERAASPDTDVTSRLERLARLQESGQITKAEFEVVKSAIIKELSQTVEAVSATETSA